MSALTLIGADLVRALARVAAGLAVNRAVRARADALAREIEEREPGATARVVPRGARDVAIVVAAPGLFAREFGSLAKPADPLIGPAIARAASRT